MLRFLKYQKINSKNRWFLYKNLFFFIFLNFCIESIIILAIDSMLKLKEDWLKNKGEYIFSELRVATD